MFISALIWQFSVYDAPLPVRRQQLAFLRTALSGPVLSTYVDKIIDETQDYFSQWGESGEIDLLETLSELTILTASRCLMGDDVRHRAQPLSATQPSQSTQTSVHCTPCSCKLGSFFLRIFLPHIV